MPGLIRTMARAVRTDLDNLRDFLAVPAQRDIAGIAKRQDAALARLEAIGERLDAALDAPAAASPAPTAAVAPVDTKLMLHQGRTALLRQMPAGAGTLLSAGCAGAWYFEWVARCYGPVRHHIGLEYYMPKPEGLPANVSWIENTVSDMSGVADRSCDLIFSGQNVEHLWPEEVAGFLLEAARVARPGATLVVDSPNRALTAPFNWSHREHTIELTPEEMEHGLQLAGFDVTRRAGIWLCRDPADGRLLPYDPNTPDADWSMTERLMAAVDHPADSFLWWIEARRADRAPDEAAVRRWIEDLFVVAWPERMRRWMTGVGRIERRGGADWVVTRAGEGGALLYGPMMPLRAGRYCAQFEVDRPDGRADGVRCQVMGGEDDVLLAERAVPDGAGPVTIEIPFTLPSLTFGMQFRCIASGARAAACRRHVEITETGSAD